MYIMLTSQKKNRKDSYEQPNNNSFIYTDDTSTHFIFAT